jgi:signal transduction histidine kinase/ActR/RegA family two-component response regulator
MHIIRRKTVVPVIALVLTACAIAAVWALVDRSDTARRQQLQINAMTLAVTDLQSAPFKADPRAGGSPPKVHAQIQADEQSILRGLAPHAQVGAPLGLLAAGRSDLITIRPIVMTIFATAVSPGLAAASASNKSGIVTQQMRLTQRSAGLSRVLAKISRADADRASSANANIKLGAAVVMMLLALAFAFFYLRSAAARIVVERLGDEARSAADANAVARDEAVEASNAKSMFIATVSHELRTPLTGVIGMSDLLLDSGLDQQQHEYAHLSRSAAEGLLLVINDILDYSKIEAGKIELDPRDFSFRETVGEACAMLLLAARDKGVELNVRIGAGLPAWLHGDAARLRQILINLVSNAVKFTDHGEINVVVQATPLAHATKIRVEVADSGIGISPEAIARLFQPFTQADNSTARKYGGTGLGLTISAQLIEAMGGAIGATSEPGKGSTFWFELSLPAAQTSEPQDLVVPDLGLHTAAVGALTEDALVVLVAEDNPVNQIIASRMLEKIGYRAELVNDGREALAAIHETRYAAVLMDCQMPAMDGYEATREIRRAEHGRDRLPIIAMTAHSMPGDREKCLAAGMDDYISKPIGVDALRDTLARTIAHEERQVRR